MVAMVRPWGVDCHRHSGRNYSTDEMLGDRPGVIIASPSQSLRHTVLDFRMAGQTKPLEGRFRIRAPPDREACASDSLALLMFTFSCFFVSANDYGVDQTS